MKEGSSILITGGTGSFGHAFVDYALKNIRPRRLIVYSRDELKQSEMAKLYPPEKFPAMRFFIGDVRDGERLRRAMRGVETVVHAAAMKQVPACEYNPIEALRTNVTGAENIINAAIDAGVAKVLALSTDKAVNPVNLYGATKLVAEKLFVQANSYSGKSGTRFACSRYGNVVGSRGSVIPLFEEQRKTGVLTVTDARMTRFWITLEDGVKFVLSCLDTMTGGEIFIPKIPSMSVANLAKAMAPGAKIKYIGIRPGEKIHEVLISVDESRNALELKDRYIILPSEPYWAFEKPAGTALAEGFQYASDQNPEVLSAKDLARLGTETDGS